MKCIEKVDYTLDKILEYSTSGHAFIFNSSNMWFLELDFTAEGLGFDHFSR